MSDILWHRHHLVPVHAGGADDASNIVKVNVAMHAFLHEQLYKEHGRKQDYWAWKGLSGQASKSEIIKGLISHKGESNPRYGHKWDQATKDFMVTIQGKPVTTPLGEFPSARTAAKRLNWSRNKVMGRIRSKNFPEWRYKDA